MNGKKMARIKRCARCRYNRNTGYWNWPRCCYHDRTGEREPLERDDAFMEGPDSNCPAGSWGELSPEGPTDEAEYHAWARRKRRELVRKRKIPGIAEKMDAVRRASDVSLTPDALLQAAVALGVLPAWAAQEIRDERGGNQDGR